MNNVHKLDASDEAEGQRLLTVAFETVPVGEAPAGELLRQVRRHDKTRRRVRTLVPAGAVAALGGAAAVAVTLTATVASAPSAFAAVTAAAAKTSAESFRVTMHGTTKELVTPTSHWEVTGEFAPSRGVGEEAAKSGKITVIYSGQHVYQNVQNVPGADKPWDEFKIWPMTDAQIAISPQFAGDAVADPGALLSLLKSAGALTNEGPASGPGWTGTRYGFTVTARKDSATTSGTVDVDGQGQVRRLLATATFAVGQGRHFTFTEDVTFSDFGVPVTVTVPPASQVSVFNGYVLGPYAAF